LAGYGGEMSEMAGCDLGELLVAWAGKPPRLAVAATEGRVLVTLPLLALIEAGESPWAQVSDMGRVFPAGDPFGYQGAALTLGMGGRTAVYRVGGWVPSRRGYIAQREQPERRPLPRV
jgi:hypothetical protein